MSQTSKSPEAIDRTLGALTLPTLKTMLEASSN
jgi:hypothetical protein